MLELKTPYRDGTTHVIMTPLEFLQRLAALVPRPRLHLIRFHGVLAPNSALRTQIVPAHADHPTVPADDPTDEPTRLAQSRLNWVQLLKRLVEDETEGGRSRVRLLVNPAIGPVDDAVVTETFLASIGSASETENLMAMQWRGAGFLIV